MPQSTNDKVPARGIFALFKGDSGSGKSVGALSFPEPYVLDHDRKMPAIAQKHFPGKKVDWDTFNDVFEISDVIKNFWDNGCPYQTLIVDSVTTASYTALKTIDDVKGQDIFSMLKNIKNTKAGSKQIELRGYDAYNGEDNFLKWYIDILKALWAREGNPKHVIVIAHVLTKESQDIKTKIVTKTRRIVTAGQAIAAYIPAQFDETYHFGTIAEGFDVDAQIRHVCSTQAVGDDSAKTAYNLKATIDFTNGSLYDKISAQVDIGKEKTLI